MAKFYLRQQDCAFYNDGTEAGSTLISGGNIVVGDGGSKPFDTTILFRALIQEYGGKAGSSAFRLKVQKNGAGGYLSLAAVTGITAVNSPDLTQGDDCTQRLGGGTFVANNNGVGDNGDTGSCSYASGEESEVLFAFEIDEADVNDADYFDFRVYNTSDSALDAYTETLRVTVSKVAPITVNLSQASLTLSPQQLDVVPGAVTKTMSQATLTLTPQRLTVVNVPPPVTINLNPTAIAITPQQLDVVPGAVTVSLNQATLTLTPQQLDVLVGGVTIGLNQVALTLTPQQLSIIAGAVTVGLNQVTLTLTPQQLDVVPGAVTISFDASALTLTPQQLNVTSTTKVSLNQATLTLTPQQLDVVPGSVSVNLNQAGLTLTPQQLDVVAGIVVSLNQAGLSVGVQQLDVIPGAISVTLNTASLGLTPQQLDVVAGAVSIALNQAGLTLTPQQLSVDISGNITISLDEVNLTLSPQQLDVITDIIVALDPVSMGLTPAQLTVTIPTPPVPPAPGGRTGGGNWRLVSEKVRKWFLRALFPLEADEIDELEVKEILAILDTLDQLDMQDELASVSEEHIKSLSSYAFELRELVRQLYATGDIGLFQSLMMTAVDRNLSRAWFDGMKACGILPSEISPAEERARTSIILISLDRIGALANDIMTARASGIPVTSFYYRIEIWANRWSEAYNTAQAMACGNKKLKWVLGPTEHCTDCLKLSGKVKRAEIWQASGVLPQSQVLECGGWNCQCSLVPTTEPMTSGPLPGVHGLSASIIAQAIQAVGTGVLLGGIIGTRIADEIFGEDEE